MDNFNKKIKTFFKNAATIISHTPNKKCVVIWSILLFVSLSLTFVTGIFSKKTEFEVAGHEISEIVQNNTRDSEYSYMLVESKDENKPLPGTVNEYHFWFDLFKESRNSFLGVVNGNKDQDIRFVDSGQDELLTFVYADVFTNVEYNGHWKHEYYHIELMFKGDHNFNWGGDIMSFCYITETQAKKILGNDSPSYEEYESLLGTTVQIFLNGVITNWHIGNIILENNDVTDCIKILFDNWIMTYSRFPKGVNKQFCYIFNEYDFQNMYKLEYMNQRFKQSNDFLIVYGINNLVSNISSDNIISAIQSDITYNFFLEIFFFVISCIIFIISMYLLCLYKFLSFKTNMLWLLICCILPYLIFSMLNKLLNYLYLFSFTGLIFYLILIGTILFYIVFFIFSNKENKI